MAKHQSEHSSNEFYDFFLQHQKQFLEELTSASTDLKNPPLQPLLNRVIQHYELYYKSKSKRAKLDVVSMFSPSWTSSLEDAFLWIGGWRPSIAFQLLYSAAGLQFEIQFHEVISGFSAGNLGDLSGSQLTSIDGFQRHVIKEERKTTEEMASHQETVADPSMVELSKVVTQMQIREGSDEITIEDAELMDRKVESTLAPKEKGLEEILHKADDLRLATLKGILEILSPLQSVHFLIAVAQLHLRFHEWGAKKDAHPT